MIPKYWQVFVEGNDLIGSELEIPASEDLSGLGIDMKIMPLEQCLSETNECYPGIAASKKGFFSVGMCLEGSGDYYYINTNDGKGGPMYRIYHDAVENERLDKDAVDKVLQNYDSIH